MLPRRGFITSALATLCAPVIIRTPGLLMPVRPMVVENLYDFLPTGYDGYMTMVEITREALRVWKTTNVFLQSVESQYPCPADPVKLAFGQTLRIRLPNQQG